MPRGERKQTRTWGTVKSKVVKVTAKNSKETSSGCKRSRQWSPSPMPTENKSPDHSEVASRGRKERKSVSKVTRSVSRDAKNANEYLAGDVVVEVEVPVNEDEFMEEEVLEDEEELDYDSSDLPSQEEIEELEVDCRSSISEVADSGIIQFKITKGNSRIVVQRNPTDTQQQMVNSAEIENYVQKLVDD